MTQVCNLWVKWIALEIDQTNESQIDSNSDDDQPHLIKQSIIRPNVPIIKMPISLGLQRSEDWKLMLEDKEQSNSLIDLIAFSLIINWYPCLNSKELTYLSPHHFFWPLVILVIPIFIIISRNLLTWLLSNPTHRFELIKHFFVISPKAQLFGAPNIYSVITWPIT